jgi:predicted nucleic acid-binding protein
MGIVLDSSVLIATERGRFDLDGLLAAHPRETFHTTVITYSELQHGRLRADTENRGLRREQFIERVYLDFPPLSFGMSEASTHAVIWVTSEKSGLKVGAHDLLIAAIAMANNHMLATLNRKEFAQILGLKFVDVEKFQKLTTRPS